MTDSPERFPDAVARAWALDDARVEPIAIGWINRTWRVERGGDTIVLQRLHRIFRAEVNHDIDAITRHLAAAGLTTPRIVPTVEGALSVEADGVWRALTYVPGTTHEALDPPSRARSAGALVGRFHRALADLDHAFAFTRPGAHDTPAHLAKLRGLRAGADDPEIDPLADDVLAAGAGLPAIGPLPERIIHGDLKATNLRFDEAGEHAIALLDLDTLQRGTLAVELGDALRSWCNPTREDDPEARFDAERFAAAIEGYLEGVGDAIGPEEARAIVPGVETIAVELASRFAADVYEDAYFGWDAARHPSRRAHNLARTRAQLALARSVRAQRDALLGCVDRLLA